MTQRYELIMSHSDGRLDAIIATYDSYKEARTGLVFHTDHWDNYRIFGQLVIGDNIRVLFGDTFATAYRIQPVNGRQAETVLFVG